MTKIRRIQKCPCVHKVYLSPYFWYFSSLSSEKERILYSDFNVTLSYERTRLCTLLSFSFLLIVRPFLHNDLLSFQLVRLFFLFSYGPSLIWKENATWFSLAFLLFHLPLCSLPHSSISLFLSMLLFLPARLSPPFVDAQCSHALNHGSVLVGLPLSSPGFWILAFSVGFP